MTNTLQPIQIDGIDKGSLVAVAMSGGVDSSVAAALIVASGYQVIGITLQLYDHGAMALKKGACCAGQDIYDARSVADKLGFPHYVLDYESVFRQSVIDDFVESYLKGETPIPCVRCNQKVKFRDLLKTAKDLGAKCLATGHYVQRIENNKTVQMHRAVDPARDQSYFLFTTTRDQLDYLRFPLGGMPKVQTRAYAQHFGLQVAEKPDSQDICFVTNGNYASVVEKFRPGALSPGDIVHMDGRVLGQHQGIIHYTVGQRRGLGIASSEPLFVTHVEPHTKRVIVGPREALAKKSLWVGNTNLLANRSEFQEGKRCIIKIRSSQEPIPAIVYLHDGGFAEVMLREPEFGIANGQACVFYDGSQVLGGGWLMSKNNGLQ